MPLNAPATEDIRAGFLEGTIEPTRVLLESERPIVFETKSVAGQALLAYLCDEQADSTWYVVAPTGPATISDLEAGLLSVREALTSSWMWLARTDGQDRVDAVWQVTAADLPDEFLPRPGTPLLSEHEPLLVARAIGNGIVAGRVPSSVVSFVAEGTRRAVKALIDLATETVGAGRPRNEQRGLDDLPVQQIAFTSFAIAFARPAEGLFDRDVIRFVGERLDAIARWVAGDAETPEPWRSDAERSAMLAAAECLTPPRFGPIREIELSGRWLRRGPVHLSRESREKVRMQLRNSPPDRVVTFTGRIGKLDKDKLTFTLRDLEDGYDQTGSFAENLLDDVIDYFADDLRVTVAGKQSGEQLFVTTIAAADA